MTKLWRFLVSLTKRSSISTKIAHLKQTIVTVGERNITGSGEQSQLPEANGSGIGSTSVAPTS